MTTKKLLSAKQQAVVDRHLEYDSKSRNHNATATVWELIARKTLAAHEKIKDPIWRKLRRTAHLPDDQLLVICMTGEASQDGLFAPNCVGDGILRRFSMNSPLELALRLSIGARYHWAESQWCGNNYDDELFRPILQAVAARDFTAADHLARIAPPIIEKPSSRSYASIYTGVVALLRKDRHLLQEAVRTFTTRDPAYVKSIKWVLDAAADDSAVDFAAGMQNMLAAYRRYMYGSELYGLIDPHALGLYELCRQFSPTLVESFDIERKLPWDREYYAWSQQIQDISAFFEIDAIPEVMRPLLLRFEPIPWGKAVLANWNCN